MAEINLEETFKKSGVLIDITSAVLEDPDGTFGVKRNDTGAVIVVAGTAMTKDGTGTYSYAFDEPVAETGLVYTYWVKWVYNGRTYYDEHTVTGSTENNLTPTRSADKYITWIENEFKPLTLATASVTGIIEQQVENAIRYWNTHSGYKISMVYDYTSVNRIQLDTDFKTVVQVYPTKTTTWIWNDHPMWTLTGVTVLDTVTTDLIMMSEAFRNYRIYVGTDFRWVFDKSDDPSVGGHLYAINVPRGVQSLLVVGTKRVTKNEDIKVEYILEWLLYYTKALVKQIEGNTLRKSGIVGITNDGQQLVDEGKEEMKDLQDRLARDSRWLVFARRM